MICDIHTGSLLVAGGQDIVTVKDATGHRDIKMTQRYLAPAPSASAPACQIYIPYSKLCKSCSTYGTGRYRTRL
jgi:hypothetical protein